MQAGSGRAVLPLVLALLFLAGCSKQGKTNSKFTVSLAGITSEQASAGGFYLEAISDKAESLKFEFSNSSPEVTIPNGTWTFYVVTFEGPAQWSGLARCGNSSEVKLEGVDTSLNITIDNPTCSNSPYPAMIAALSPSQSWDNAQWDSGVWAP